MKLPQVAAIAALLFGLSAPGAAQTMLGPSAYLSFADSPFSGLTFSTYFHHETFEDGLFNVPGVSKSAGSVIGPGGSTDSVDADDGAIDGSGTNGRSVFGFGTVTFTFNDGVLGALPTHVGIVWTDGGNPTFTAYASGGSLLGTVTGSFADGSTSGTTAEDRFLGIIHTGGISHITINASSWEYDHLQYGYTAIPEPSTWAALAGAGALIGAVVRRRFSRR